MRKSITGAAAAEKVQGEAAWLELAEVAAAEMTSEDPAHPLENALGPAGAGGWRAAQPGRQSIRLLFDSPQRVRRVKLEFRETKVERSQEFALFATTEGSERREVVRQQWSFSPGGSTSEVEDYRLDLQAVTMLELELDPGRHDQQVFASLEALRVG